MIKPKLRIDEIFLVECVPNQAKDEKDYTKVVITLHAENQNDLDFLMNGSVAIYDFSDDKSKGRIHFENGLGSKRIDRKFYLKRKQQDIIWLDLLFENDWIVENAEMLINKKFRLILTLRDLFNNFFEGDSRESLEVLKGVVVLFDERKLPNSLKKQFEEKKNTKA